MDIDSIQWKSIILTVLISLWLPQLLITEASQNGNNKTDSCENGTETWPQPMSFDPYDPPTSQKVFTPAFPSLPTTLLPSNTIRETLKASLGIELTPSPIIQVPSERIEPTPTIIRYLISSSLPSDQSSSSLRSKDLSSHLLSTDDGSLSSSLSSSMMVPTPLLSSSVQSTPINELIRESISLYRVSSSSPVQSSSVEISILSSPIVNENATFRSDASHTVTPNIPTHPHGQQPSGAVAIDGSIYRVSQSAPKVSANEPLTTITTNYDNETPVNMQSPPTTASIDFSSLANNPKDNSEIINGTSLSHNMNPTSSSFFPALSGTISFIPNEGTTDITFPWTTPIDNIIYYNSNNETNNHDDDVGGSGYSQNHHGTPEAATSNITKCDHRENRFTQPTPDSGFLVRSVLKRYGDEYPLSLDNLTASFEARLAAIFNLAYRNQLKGLGLRPDKIEKDIHVKLWNLFWNNSTDDFHLIYQIEQDNHKLIARDLQTLLSHISPEETSTILGYNGTIKAEPYVNTLERKNTLASALKDLDWLPFLMIFLSVIVLIFCSLLTLIIWRKNRRLRRSSTGALGPPGLDNSRLKTRSSIAKPIIKVNTKESLVNWRKVSGPGSKRSFLGSHGGSAAGLNISGGCSATSGTIDSNHEFEYLSFDSPTSSLKLRTAEYRPRRPYTGFSNHGLHGSQSRLELTKEKVIPIGELDEIAELSSNSSSHDAHHPHHQHHHINHNHHQQHPTPGSRMTYVTTKEEMIGDYENPLMRSDGVDEVDCSVPQLIQVHISEQTQNIIQAIRSELKKFNPITGTNVSSQSIPTQLKESTSTSDA